MTTVSRGRADWSDFKIFWAVAETKSFGAAARALRVNQSTVTRRIDELEHRLNARMFVRNAKGVSLTEAGKKTYDRVKTMQSSADAIERMVVDADSAPHGHVGLAAPDGVAGIFLTPTMPEFLRANPKIQLSIDCALWPDRPLEGDVDLYLTFTKPAHPDIVARPIAHFHYGVFAGPAYAALYKLPETLAETAAHPFIHHVGQIHQQDVWHKKAAPFQAMAERRLETNSSAVSFAAVKHGAGLGLMPTGILELEPSLIMLDLPILASVKLWLYHHRDNARSARVNRVAEWVEAAFDPLTKPWYREEIVHPDDFRHLLPQSPAVGVAKAHLVGERDGVAAKA